MTLRLTYCVLCLQGHPPLIAFLHNLLHRHADQVYVVELKCMAACDDNPAVIIGVDYIPRITLRELEGRVQAHLGTSDAQ
jgi:hypothetical protein